MADVLEPRSASSDPLMKAKFKVFFKNLEIGFQEVTGITDETGVSDYKDGRDPNIKKILGQDKSDPIVCSRAVSRDIDTQLLINYRQLAKLRIEGYRDTLVVWILDQTTGLMALEFTYPQAFISKLEFDDLDGKSDDPMAMKVTFEHEGVEYDHTELY